MMNRNPERGASNPLVLFVLAAVLALSTFAVALVPVTPWDAGSGWVADVCWSKFWTAQPYECCSWNCHNLYKGSNNAGAAYDCIRGCENQIKYDLLRGRPLPPNPVLLA